MELPFGGGMSRPTDEQALAIFDGLLRGIYDAMGAEREEAIYLLKFPQPVTIYADSVNQRCMIT